MRVIAGKYGGRKLTSFDEDHIRPTTDRIKGVIFNKLQDEFENANVIDLFSGTGSLGIEALSRGAASVKFVEKNGKSLQIIKKNLQTLGVTEPYTIEKNDVIKFLKNHESSYDIILIDPPFTEKMADEVMIAVSQSKIFQKNSVIVIESSKHEKINEKYDSLVLFDQKNYGDKFLSFFNVT